MRIINIRNYNGILFRFRYLLYGINRDLLIEELLSSFKPEEDKTQIEKITAVHKGYAYQDYCYNYLSSYGFNLRQVGQSGDEGIDLEGSWDLPDQNIRTLIQCKNYKIPIQPLFIREFIGALSHEDPIRILGIFISPNGYSQGSYSLLEKSKLPLVFITLKERCHFSYFKINSASAILLTNLYICEEIKQNSTTFIKLYYKLKERVINLENHN